MKLNVSEEITVMDLYNKTTASSQSHKTTGPEAFLASFYL